LFIFIATKTLTFPFQILNQPFVLTHNVSEALRLKNASELEQAKVLFQVMRTNKKTKFSVGLLF